MAVIKFANKTELVSMMVDTLNRLGSTVIPDRCESWIQLHEARANRVIRNLQMVVRAQASLTNGYIKLPPDWREAQQIQINDLTSGKPRPLDLVTQEQADRIREDGVITDPEFYCITGTQLEVVPYTAVPLQIEMAYYRQVPALSADVPTNWLLQLHPDYYLYGSLIHSAPYLRDDDRIQTWSSLASDAENQIGQESERARFSGSRLRSRAKLRC